MLNLKKLFIKKIKIESIQEKLENKKDDLSYEIKKRWNLLLKSGYFIDWQIENDNCIIDYSLGDDYGKDVIPIIFFEIEDNQEAEIAYTTFVGKQKQNALETRNKEIEIKEKELFLKLKKKFGE